MRNVAGVEIPVPGIAIGFWEPVGLIDVTRTPFCLVNMAGTKLAGLKTRRFGTNHKTPSSEESQSYSFYNVHTYKYPLIYWFEILTDLGCLEMSSFDIGYMSEFDPTWNDDSLASILHPEAFMFTSVPAVLSCTADCVAATTNMPIDDMPWCAGCLGSIYPFGGRVAGHNGGIQASSLLSIRAIAKEHRLGMALETSTDTSQWFNGPLCRKHFAPVIKKSQYKLQLTYPISMTKGEFTCVPFGMSDVLYNSFKEFPFGGEDFGYLLWRKKNCCFL
jgi:conjugal transfer pilus assembly protein TraU